MRFMHKSHSRFGSRSLRRPSSGSQSCATSLALCTGAFAAHSGSLYPKGFVDCVLLCLQSLERLAVAAFLGALDLRVPPPCAALDDVLVLSLAGGQPFAQVLLGGCLSFAPFPELRLARIVVSGVFAVDEIGFQPRHGVAHDIERIVEH